MAIPRKLARSAFKWSRQVLPPLSEAERTAIASNGAWWVADLLGGAPDWDKLVALPPARLTVEEQAFFDGPVAELCALSRNLQERGEASDEVVDPALLDVLESKGFFRLGLARSEGGLGFSHTAQSEILRQLASIEPRLLLFVCRRSGAISEGLALPAVAAAGAAVCARAAGAWAAIASVGETPLASTEAVRHALAELLAEIYRLDAMRLLAASALDAGHRASLLLSVVGEDAAEGLHRSLNLAEAIFGAATPNGVGHSLQATSFRQTAPEILGRDASPLSDRRRAFFAEMVLRAHAFWPEERAAVSENDAVLGLEAFEKPFAGHLAHGALAKGRAFLSGWTGGLVAHAPEHAENVQHWQQLSRYAAAFSFLSELVLLTLGSELDGKDLIGRRLAVILSELTALSAVLKRFECDACPDEDRPLVDYLMARGIARLRLAFSAVIDNLPARWAALLFRLTAFPLGVSVPAAADDLACEVGAILASPSHQRSRLTQGLCVANDERPMNLERAFAQVSAARPLQERLRDAGLGGDLDEALAEGLLSEEEWAQLREANAAQTEFVSRTAAPEPARSPHAETQT
ncbi:acyl-CoA dehydrogenase domain-containing protein [Consotaella salsifontis]|uniref:Acyl-CoA dehydrogenase n=1 Tax=Consotaella salsifontis TaxID=1365950 RepID=A0A1T4MZ11_9HYPH|nr:acyl-CoA dehydrogenase domain-containing protein [Consotaella salsifontis]SJZ72232.1 acyl-CoA dehydrogenase [Consotaella salsifontis]